MSIGNSDGGPHVDHAHQFNVVVYGDCDVGVYRNRTDAARLTFQSISIYFNLCARHQPDAVASVAHPLPRGGCQRRDIGAGNGGRTRVFSLEG